LALLEVRGPIVTEKKNPSRFFYGYIIVAATFWIMAVAWGANRTFGVFLSPLTQEFGWSRAGISGAFTLCMIVLGSISLAAGRLTDRLGPRQLTLACGIFLGGGFLFCSRLDNLWQLYFFFGVFTGIGMSGTWAPMMSTVARWFIRYRSLMSGILAAGPTTGIVFMPLLMTWLIDRVGWRISFALLGGFTFLGLTAAALFLKRDPGQIGASPLGMDEKAGTWADLQNRGLSLSEAFRTRSFWILNLISLCDALLVNVMIVHIVPHVITLGIDPLRAATVLSLAAGVSIPARIAMGHLADRMGNRRGLAICLAMSVIAFALLPFARGMMSLWVFAVLYGIGLWTTGAVMSPFIADLFGLKAHGSIFSCTVFSGSFGGGLGPFAVGALFDLTGTYQAGFLVCLAASIISFVSLYFVPGGRPFLSCPSETRHDGFH
jgi:OFA family oxalate/formate antiporter-like MFS transporter